MALKLFVTETRLVSIAVNTDDYDEAFGIVSDYLDDLDGAKKVARLFDNDHEAECEILGDFDEYTDCTPEADIMLGFQEEA